MIMTVKKEGSERASLQERVLRQGIRESSEPSSSSRRLAVPTAESVVSKELKELLATTR
jgi:hypothetical protein